jgi:hypothetical protein
LPPEDASCTVTLCIERALIAVVLGGCRQLSKGCFLVHPAYLVSRGFFLTLTPPRGGGERIIAFSEAFFEEQQVRFNVDF